MSVELIECIEKIALAAIGAAVTIATAYIAARYAVSRMDNNRRGDSADNNPDDDTSEVKK